MQNLLPEINQIIAGLGSMDADALLTSASNLLFKVLLRNYLPYFLIFIIAMIVAVVLLVRSKSNRIRSLQVKLVEKTQITHDTVIFTFNLPSNVNSPGLKIGQHLQIQAMINGEKVERKYTPISRADLKCNSFKLLIKIYRKTEQFPNGGVMSQYLDSLNLGDHIKITLPYGHFNYLGKSQAAIKELGGKTRNVGFKSIYMVGGGTGITPLYQVIQYITESQDTSVAPNIHLLFANRSENDILMANQLKDLQKRNPKFTYTLSVDRVDPSSQWDGLVGFVDLEKIQKTAPKDLQHTLFVSCGPPILCNNFQKILFSNLNVKTHQIFRF